MAGFSLRLRCFVRNLSIVNSCCLGVLRLPDYRSVRDEDSLMMVVGSDPFLRT